MISNWIYVITAVILCGLAIVVGRYLSLWLQAFFTGTRISLLDLVLMSLRKSDPRTIVQCKAMAVQSGLTAFSTSALEAQYLAGGNVHNVTLALIAANRAGIFLDWNTAAAIDLAGRDVMEAVRVSVDPKVIDCPDPKDGGDNSLYGVAKDGIQLKVRVRVTVRTNLSQLVGGATEATVIARVGQGIISAIGSCNSYREALRDPMVITRKVIAKGLDSETAFAIVSIDIAAIDVGTNIGAQLQIAQAGAAVRVARAAAEKRRAMAIARQQEMSAELAKSRAMLVSAEAEIPMAIAMAFRKGQLHAGHLRRETEVGIARSDEFTRNYHAGRRVIGIQIN
ncbi:MAG: flotillin-like FloA family protein [Planctomycetaceae bacterium]|nr:flotillin-like FloA family protein [Planctomycetaceae bacterium]